MLNRREYRPQLGSLTAGGSSGAGIKSQQEFTIDFGTSTSTTKDTTITAVDTANTRLIHVGFDLTPGGSDTIAQLAFTNSLLSSTAIRSTRSTGTNVSGRYKQRILVREYYPGIIKSIQTFSITVSSGGTTQTQAITAVDTAKADIVITGARSASASSLDMKYLLAYGSFNSSTEIQVNTTSAPLGASVIFSVEVIEFY